MCLAVAWAVLLLRTYLEGDWITIRTDHEAITMLLMMSDASGKLPTWDLRLSKFEFGIVHRADIKTQAPLGSKNSDSQIRQIKTGRQDNGAKRQLESIRDRV